jgi:hypothetical protein
MKEGGDGGLVVPWLLCLLLRLWREDVVGRLWGVGAVVGAAGTGAAIADAADGGSICNGGNTLSRRSSTGGGCCFC